MKAKKNHKLSDCYFTEKKQKFGFIYNSCNWIDNLYASWGDIVKSEGIKVTQLT